MATKIDLCNQALDVLHVDNINALSDTERQAVLCNRWYDDLRRRMLRDHAWNFATKRVVLAEVSDEYTNWSYAYGYPSDCLYARRVLPPSGTDTVIDFVVQKSSSSSGRVILTNAEDAELEYTVDVEIVNEFDPLFQEALVFNLAAKIAGPLKGKQQIVQAMYQAYFVALSRAKMGDANEGSLPLQQSNTFVDAR